MTKDQSTLLLVGDADLAAQLLSRFTLRVLTRDAAEGERLRELGVDVVDGDLDDRASIRAAVQGCKAVVGVVRKEAQGRNLIKIVAGSDIEQFVLHAAEGRDELERYAVALAIHPTDSVA